MRYADISTADLFELLFGGEYEERGDEVRDEGPSEALRVLGRRDVSEVYALAVHHLDSTVALERGRALDVLARLGAGAHERPYENEVAILALRHLRDPDSDVWSAATYALGTFARAAAGGKGSGRAELVGALLAMMRDPDDWLRNWATFVMAMRKELDSEQIRAALRERLGDSCNEVRDEAAHGLAVRAPQR